MATLTASSSSPPPNMPRLQRQPNRSAFTTSASASAETPIPYRIRSSDLHKASRAEGRSHSEPVPGQRTSITALPTMTTCLHKLPFLSPEDAQPLIAHNSSPRSDEGVRETMLWDSLTTTQRERQRRLSSSSSRNSRSSDHLIYEASSTGCVACNNAIALAQQHHTHLRLHPHLPPPPSQNQNQNWEQNSNSTHHQQQQQRLPSLNPNFPISESPASRSPAAALPPRSSSSHSLALSTRSAPASSSNPHSYSHSRPSSIASNGSSRKIFSLTPLDGDGDTSFDYTSASASASAYSTLPNSDADDFRNHAGGALHSSSSDFDDDDNDESKTRPLPRPRTKRSGSGSYAGTRMGLKTISSSRRAGQLFAPGIGPAGMSRIG